MKLVIISDTHNDHEALGTLSGDVLIHCGDFSLGGRADPEAIRRVDAWFARQQFQLILCTGGNHDFELAERSARGQPTFAHATYLENQAITFQGVRFYGAPWLPELRGWAFYQSDEALAEQWAKIPEQTDVLITHTPPYGILDANSAGWQCGCRELRRRVDELTL